MPFLKASTPSCRMVPPHLVISTRPAMSSGAIYSASAASASQKMIRNKGHVLGNGLACNGTEGQPDLGKVIRLRICEPTFGLL